MIPFNFPNPPNGCTHKIVSKNYGEILYFYDKDKERFYDTQFGNWLSSYWTLRKLSNYFNFTIEPLHVELENK